MGWHEEMLMIMREKCTQQYSMIILFAEKQKWLYISLCLERYLEEYNDIYQTVGI